MFVACSWYVPGMFMAHSWHIHGTSMAHSFHVHEMCVAISCLVVALSVHVMFMAHTWHVYDMLMEFAWKLIYLDCSVNSDWSTFTVTYWNEQHLLWKNSNILEYCKVTSSSKFRLVAHPRIFRLFMKGKFDAYVLWPFAKKDPKLNSSPVSNC